MIKVTSTIKIENEEIMNRMFAMLVENFGVKIQYVVEPIQSTTKVLTENKGN